MSQSLHSSLNRRISVDAGSVAPSRPLVWLRLGLKDLEASWSASLAHGALMTGLGWILLLMLGNNPYFVSVAVSGFLLLAPIMTTGLCELSRLREAGLARSFNDSLEVLSRERLALFKFGAVLGAIALLWFALSELLLARMFSVLIPSVADAQYLGFLSQVNGEQVLWFIGTGAVLAFVVFLLSVVTVPLIIDRHASAAEAMSASLRVVGANPLAMAVWSGLLVAITIVGFATFLLGMIVLIPLLGHATWHAYKDLVR